MKKLNIFIGIGLVFIIIAIFLGVFCNNIKHFTEDSLDSKKVLKDELTLIINGGQELSKTIKLDFTDGATAFDLLNKGTEELDLNLEFSTYDIGVFIEKIEDIENGEDGKYWLYYVNGKMPQVAADKQLLNSGDKVEFKFEKSLF